MLTNLLIRFGISRDSLWWFWLQVVSVAGLVSSNVLNVPYWMAYLHIPLSPTALHWIFAVSALVLWFAGKHDTSPLPSARRMASGSVPGSPVAVADSFVARTLSAVLLVVALGTSLLWFGCASTGIRVKQDIVLSTQTAEAALGVAQDEERALYASKALPALTVERHQAIARGFSSAFDAQIKLGNALQLWKAGDPVPSSINDLLQDAQDTWSVVSGLVPGVTGQQPIALIVKMRTWLAQVAALAKHFNVALPAWLVSATVGGAL